jgi:hypothetical protein
MKPFEKALWVFMAICMLSTLPVLFIGGLMKRDFENYSSNIPVPTSPVPTNPIPLVEDAITVDPTMLYVEYLNNPARADLKYKGKTVIITGRIIDIGQVYDKDYISLSDQLSVSITGAYVAAFSCYFADKDDIISLDPSDDITIKGECNGFNQVVEIINCVEYKPIITSKDTY